MRAILTTLMFISILVFFAAPASAATLVPETSAGSPDTSYENVIAVLNSLVKTVLRIAGFLVIIVIVYHGVRMATAGSNETVYGDARKGLNWAIVGALVIFGVYTIIATVEGLVNSVSR